MQKYRFTMFASERPTAGRGPAPTPPGPRNWNSTATFTWWPNKGKACGSIAGLRRVPGMGAPCGADNRSVGKAANARNASITITITITITYGVQPAYFYLSRLCVRPPAGGQRPNPRRNPPQPTPTRSRTNAGFPQPFPLPGTRHAGPAFPRSGQLATGVARGCASSVAVPMSDHVAAGHRRATTRNPSGNNREPRRRTMSNY